MTCTGVAAHLTLPSAVLNTLDYQQWCEMLSEKVLNPLLQET